MDLGSGQGITSVFLAKEYGFKVYAADLWSNLYSNTRNEKDCHDNIHKELLLSWTPEQLDYIHDIEYWKNIISKSKNSEIISIYEMESNEECWNDWIQCDNEYSKGDKKAIEAGACKYLNFIAIVLKKK